MLEGTVSEYTFIPLKIGNQLMFHNGLRNIMHHLYCPIFFFLKIPELYHDRTHLTEFIKFFADCKRA